MGTTMIILLARMAYFAGKEDGSVLALADEEEEGAVKQVLSHKITPNVKSLVFIIAHVFVVLQSPDKTYFLFKAWTLIRFI